MKNIMYVSHLLFISLLVKITREETCQTHNTQLTNVIKATGPLVIPLLNYFSGQNIQYSSNDDFISIDQITPNIQGIPFSQTNVVGMTIGVISGDPNLPTNQYGVLTYNDTDYSIFEAQMSSDQTINLNQQVNTISVKPSTAETQYCFGLGLIENKILVSCVLSNSIQTQTQEEFYITSTGIGIEPIITLIIRGTQVINSTLSNVTGKTQVVQVNGEYYVAQILTGVNSTGYIQSFYSYYQLDLVKKTVINQKFNLLTDYNNQYVDLFVSTSGVQFLLTSNYLIIDNKQIPINQAQSLGVFELQVESNYWMYLIAVAVPDGVFITDDYFFTSKFLQAPVAELNFVNVFIDPYYVAIATNSGVSIYPSYQNHVNKGYALYSDSVGIAGSTYNVITHTLTVISNTGSQYIYQLRNPLITYVGGSQFTVQQSNSGSETPCSVTFYVSYINNLEKNVSNIYPSTNLDFITYNVGMPYPTVFTAANFFQGPAITMSIQTGDSNQDLGFKTAQYFDIGKTAPLLASVTYSQNFIRSLDWTTQEIDPFNPILDIQEQLFQVVQTSLGEIVLLQVDPFTKQYKLIAQYTLPIIEDIVQFTLGMNGQDYAIGALFINGSIIIVDNNKQFKTYTPPTGLFVSQIEILDDYVYLIVSTKTEEINNGVVSTVDTEIQEVTRISNVTQVSQKLNAYGQLLFLNQGNNIAVGKLINQTFVYYVNITTPAYGDPQNYVSHLELTENGIYFIFYYKYFNKISYLPRYRIWNTDNYWYTLPSLSNYQFYSDSSYLYKAASSLTHFYITVMNDTDHYLFVFSNSDNFINTLYFAKQIPSNYSWLSVVGTKSFDFGTLGFTNDASEASGDFILYPELYVAVNTTYLSSFTNPNCTLEGSNSFSNETQNITVQFKIIDLGKSLVSLNTADPNITLLHSSLAQVDVRDYFLGNIFNITVYPPSDSSYDIVYQAPLFNLTQGNTIFFNSATTSAVRWYQNVDTNPWTVIVNNTQVYFTGYLFNPLNAYKEIQYSKIINLTEEQSLDPDVTCPYIYVDERLFIPVVICSSPSQKQLNFFAYNISSGNDSFVQIGSQQITELSSQNITNIECLISSVLIIKMTTSTTGQYQFLAFLIRSALTETKYIFNLYSLGNTMYGDSTMTPFALQDISFYTITPPLNPIELYGFISVKQSEGDTPTNVLQILTVSVAVSNNWSIVDATNNTIQEISVQNLLREYNIQPTGNLMKLITVIGQSRQLFTNTHSNKYCRNKFNQGNGQIVDVKFNCFYQGIAQYTPNSAVGGNGLFVPYYRIGDSVYVLNYGQALGHCQNQNIMTTLEVFNQYDFNGQTLKEVTQFQLLTSYTTPMIFITFGNQTSNFILTTLNLNLWFVPDINSASLVIPQSNTINLTAVIKATSCNIQENQPPLTQLINFYYVGYDSSTFQRKEHWEQLVLGGIILVIVGGVLVYLCYNSRPQAYYYQTA